MRKVKKKKLLTFTAPYRRRPNLLQIGPSTSHIYQTRKPFHLKNHEILNAQVFSSLQFSQPFVYKLSSQLFIVLIILIISPLIALELGYIIEIPNCLLNLLEGNNHFADVEEKSEALRRDNRHYRTAESRLTTE